MPALENAPEILSKKHALKLFVFVNNIDPQAFVSIRHNFERLPEWLRFINFDILMLNFVKQRLNVDGSIVLNGWFIGNSENI